MLIFKNNFFIYHFHFTITGYNYWDQCFSILKFAKNEDNCQLNSTSIFLAKCSGLNTLRVQTINSKESLEVSKVVIYNFLAFKPFVT